MKARTRSLHLTVIAVFSFVVLFITPLPALSGELREKARGYDAHYVKHHSRGLGGAVEVIFKDRGLAEPYYYDGQGDSTIHTGMYLAGQAFRYAVTGEAEARENARDAARALHHHLRVTGKPGYIARYAGPHELPFYDPTDKPCSEEERCHLAEGGTYQGHYWLGDTSRDQYDGFFFGAAIAYELVDDPKLRSLIRSDVKELMDYLERNNFIIRGINDKKTGAGDVWYLPGFRVAWTLCAARIIGEPDYRELYEKQARLFLPWTGLEYMDTPAHNFYEYYALMFYHRSGYNIHRLAWSSARQEAHFSAFSLFVRPYTRGIGNVFFDYVYESMRKEPSAKVLEEAGQALLQFPSPPNRQLVPDQPAKYIGPYSALKREFCSLRFRGKKLCSPKLRSLRPVPVRYRCPTDFLWQRSPYKVCAGHSRGNPRKVYPGIDYLLAYWMGRYHGFLGPED
ncbi:MAG: hypothetical protein R6V10_12505 [bacterium]